MNKHVGSTLFDSACRETIFTYKCSLKMSQGEGCLRCPRPYNEGLSSFMLLISLYHFALLFRFLKIIDSPHGTQGETTSPREKGESTYVYFWLVLKQRTVEYLNAQIPKLGIQPSIKPGIWNIQEHPGT